MKRHFKFAAIAVLLFTLLPVLSSYLPASDDFGKSMFAQQLFLLVWGACVLTLYLRWAMRDAVDHGRTVTSAVLFTLLLLVLNVMSHFIYLFYTRGLRHGLIASLQFFVAMLVITGTLMIINQQTW